MLLKDLSRKWKRWRKPKAGYVFITCLAILVVSEHIHGRYIAALLEENEYFWRDHYENLGLSSLDRIYAKSVIVPIGGRYYYQVSFRSHVSENNKIVYVSAKGPKRPLGIFTHPWISEKSWLFNKDGGFHKITNFYEDMNDLNH